MAKMHPIQFNLFNDAHVSLVFTVDNYWGKSAQVWQRCVVRKFTLKVAFRASETLTDQPAT